MFERLRAWLYARLRADCYYINGPDTLPQPMTPEEERECCRRFEAGDRAARDALITHNLRLVVYIARKFESSGVGIEDLISIGTIGLIKAVGTFRADRSIKLATYSSRCIENEILMHIRKIANQKTEVSLDEPINMDYDGNELLLADILGTEEDMILLPGESYVFPLCSNHGATAKKRYDLEDGYYRYSLTCYWEGDTENVFSAMVFFHVQNNVIS